MALAKLTSELVGLGIDVVSAKLVGDEYHVSSHKIDEVGPSVLNKIMFDAFDAGKLSVNPFNLQITAAGA